MAKTPSNRKANAVVAFEEEEEEEDEEEDQEDDEHEDYDDDNEVEDDDACFPNKDATPGPVSLAAKKMTPGSSGGSGMRMRSGRKKKRPKPRSEENDDTVDMPPRKRTREGGDGGGRDDGAALAKDVSAEEEKEDHNAEMTTNGNADEERKVDDQEQMEVEMEEIEDEGGASLSSSSAQPPLPSRMTTATAATTATISKVPPEATREAIAAAQVADESPYDEDDDDDDERVGDVIEDGAGDIDDVASDIDGDDEVGGRENPISRLFFQALRLPSQLGTTATGAGAEAGGGETPSSVSPPPLPPPGGRRLIFSTVRKGGGGTGAFGGYDAAGRGELGVGRGRGQNGLLAQTRRRGATSAWSTRRGTVVGDKCVGGAQRDKTSRENGASASNAAASAGQPLSLIGGWIEEEEGEAPRPFAADLLPYVGRWYLLLILILVLGNVIAMSLGDKSIWGRALGLMNANVGEWGKEWGERYGIDSEANAGDDDVHTSSPMPPPEIVIRREADPLMLAEARAAMITHRADLLEIERLEQSATVLREGLKLLDVGVRGWTTENPDMKKEVVEQNENGIAPGDVSFDSSIFFSVACTVASAMSPLRSTFGASCNSLWPHVYLLLCVSAS
jgi:hypothetical protein